MDKNMLPGLSKAVESLPIFIKKEYEVFVDLCQNGNGLADVSWKGKDLLELLLKYPVLVMVSGLEKLVVKNNLQLPEDNYAYYLSHKKFFSLEAIDELFELMESQKRYEYDEYYIEQLYVKYLSQRKEDY